MDIVEEWHDGWSDFFVNWEVNNLKVYKAAYLMQKIT